jgi:outer membrane lipoprotein-sorting protein
MVVAMTISAATRHRVRYLVPLAAAGITAAVVFIPQAASGAQHPTLAPRTAAQLLASLEQATVPQFSGTTVETARLGLPSLDGLSLPGLPTGDGSPLAQVATLLTGSHTAQLAYGGPEKQRAAIFLSDLSETDIVHNGTDVWTYSSDSNSVSHRTVTTDASGGRTSDMVSAVDPTKAAEQALAKISPSTAVRVDRTAEVAGRSAYQLDLTPRDSRSLIGSVRIALDSKTSLPLRVEIFARTSPNQPAFAVGFTSISMSPPSASTFDFTKPPSASVQAPPLSGLGSPGGERPLSKHHGASRSDDSTVVGKDWTAVYVEKLPAESSTGAIGAPEGLPTPTVKRCNGNTGLCTTVQGRPGTTPGGPSLARILDQLGTPVAAGHLITTSLVSILVTNDNRVLVGSVTPQYIEQVAASQASR